MARPILLPPAFDGMAQDFPRNNLPRGKAWNQVDYIPQVLGAPATERGGWAWASPAMSDINPASTYAAALVYAPFNAGAQLVTITDSGELIKTVAGANTAIAAAVIPLQNPFMHQQVVVIPSPDGSTAPKKYDGSAVAALGSTAPTAPYGCVFVNYTWLGGSDAQPQRGYASDVGDPTTYTLTGTSASFLDVSFPIRAMAALPNVMLWFGDAVTARVRGTTPPPGTDMQVDDPIFNYGTLDARSVAVNGSVACFANAQGVFITNGTAFPEDLTKSCGVSLYWRNLLSTYTSSWTLAAGWFGDNYIISVMDGATFKDCFLFDTKLRSAYRLSNVQSTAFAAAGGAGQELYAGSRATPRVLKLSTMWTPSATYKDDADGTAVTGVYESPFYDTDKVGGQRWRDLYLDYDLRDAATDSPTFTVSYCTSPEPDAAYTALSPVVAATSMRGLVRRPVRHKNRGMGFKLTRTSAASFARLYALGSTTYSREGSRLDY